jgi:hypothetical protein
MTDKRIIKLYVNDDYIADLESKSIKNAYNIMEQYEEVLDMLIDCYVIENYAMHFYMNDERIKSVRNPVPKKITIE